VTDEEKTWEELQRELERCSYIGDLAVAEVLTLSERVMTKRLKTVTRLLRELHRLGARVQFCQCYDWNENNPFEDGSPLTANATGLFVEDDCWVYLRTDWFRGWGMLEKVLAHYAVHFLQLLLKTEPRVTNGLNLSVYLDRCWAFDGERYRSWLEERAEEGFPVFEVEAYSEQKRPRGVACALEHVRTPPRLWEGSWYTP
jgi:hypothetical protein